MIARMLQINEARVSIGTSPAVTLPMSFLPLGVRGGDTITVNGTTLPVSQLVSQLFNITIQASDTLALKMRLPARSVESMEATAPLPIRYIPLKLKVGSAAGSINGIQPILTPNPTSMSLSTLAIGEEVLLDGIPIIFERNMSVEVSDITVVPSRLVGVPYTNFNLDALVVPSWIVDRTVDEWLGKAPLEAINATVPLDTNQLNAFLRNAYSVDSMSLVRSGDTVEFQLFSASNPVRTFAMPVPPNAIMIAVQRGGSESSSEYFPPMSNSSGWTSQWRSVILPKGDTNSILYRSPIIAASCKADNPGALNISRPWGGSPFNPTPVQFVIIHNPMWPAEGIPAGASDLKLEFAVVPRLATQPTAAISFDTKMNLTIDGRDFAQDESPFDLPSNHLTSETRRAVMFSGLVMGTPAPFRIYQASTALSAWEPTEIEVRTSLSFSASLGVNAINANPVRMSNPYGDVLSITTSGPIGASTTSNCMQSQSGNYIHLPLIIAWAAQV